MTEDKLVQTDEEIVTEIKAKAEGLTKACQEAADRGIAVEIQMSSAETDRGVRWAAIKVNGAWKNMMIPGILRLVR